ncbi:MAG: hypothetical protein ACI3WR_05255 [Oscillospiraceae bacterium]
MRFGRLAWLSFALTFVSAGLALALGEGSPGYRTACVAGQACCFAALGCWIAHMMTTKEQRTAKKTERRAARQKVRAERAAARERRRAAQAETERAQADDRRPVKAALLSTRDRYGKSVAGTAARTLLGGALFGTFGAAMGLTTARSELVGQKAVFSVKYASGRTGTETVEVGSKRFEELARLLVE